MLHTRNKKSSESSLSSLCCYCAAIQNAFHLFDKNGDGKITADELKSVIDSLLIPQTTTRADVDKMIEEADTDGNGTVEFEEFFRIMNHFMAEQDPDAEIVEAFQLFDHDKNVSVLLRSIEVHYSLCGKQLCYDSCYCKELCAIKHSEGEANRK